MSNSRGSAIDVLNTLKDTQLDVGVILMDKEFAIGDLIKLNPGAVLMFDKQDGTPATVQANGKAFAKGEVVQLGDRYGLKVTELI
jgi:flagellar motor switch protein FliN/FliY